MPINSTEIACWCGNTKLTQFSPEYLHCSNCETLILNQVHSKPIDLVKDENDFYGKHYWFEHMTDDLDFENIVTRARTDIPERVLYWLQTLLKYQLPPAKTLELGCAHGGFVAALSWSGFDAMGLELSPWIVDFARKTFGISVLEGKLEEQKFEPASFDAIIMMDVLEHLPDPLHTMQIAVGLLKPDGIFMVQTPCYPKGKEFNNLAFETHPFLEQLKPPEHLFLFSNESIERLFSELSCNYVVFEQPIFFQYDMFVIAGRQVLKINDQAQIGESLQCAPSGRMIQALLDLKSIKENIIDRLQISEEDREKRLRVIQEQGERLGKIEAERNNLAFENADLKKQIRKLEKELTARLRVIHEQGKRLGQIEAERNNLACENADIKEQFHSSEEDRATRLTVLHEQGDRLGQIEAERNNLAYENADLKEQMDKLEEDRAARLRVIHEQGERLGQIEAERNNFAFENTDLKEHFRKVEEDRAARLEIINEQAIQYDELRIKYEQLKKKKRAQK